jgi:hypothetical protein
MRRAFLFGCLLSSAAAIAAPQNDLWTAAEKGSVAKLAASLKAGAAVNARDGDGWTALMFAAAAGNAANVAFLLTGHADPNLAARDGTTPLMAAVAGGNGEAVAVLLRAGAQPGARNRNGLTAGDVARERRRADLTAMLDARPAAAANHVPAAGVPPVIIKTFLQEEAANATQAERTRAAIGAAAAAKARNDAALAAQVKARAAAEASQKLEACTARLDSCLAGCGSGASTSTMLGTLSSSRTAAANAAQQALLAMARAKDCQQECKSRHDCEGG